MISYSKLALICHGHGDDAVQIYLGKMKSIEEQKVALERDLWAQRVAALRGMNKYCFKRTRARAEVPEAMPNSVGAIPSLSPAPHHMYATDESTGECKTQ